MLNVLSLCSGLDLEHSDAIFSHTIKLRLVAKGSTVQQTGKKWSNFDYLSPECDLDLEDSKPIFSPDSTAESDASPYQV